MADKSQNLFGAFQHEQQFHKIFESIFFSSSKQQQLQQNMNTDPIRIN